MGAIAGRPGGDAVGGSGAEGPHPVGSSGPVMGMDLGGTYMRAALADEYGRIVLERRVETLAREGREAVLGRVVALLNEVKGEAGGRGVSAVGVGAPGPLDPEAGHVVVEPGGPECSCGGRGHLEALASGTAIARQAREALSSGEDTILGKLSGGDPERVTAELAHEAALAGDPLCVGPLGAAGRRVGHALVGLVHLFNPEVVVLGGGVTGAGDLFWGPLRETLWGGLIPTFAEGLRLNKSALGDHAGLYGAAALAIRAVRDAPAITDASAELRTGKGGPRG